MTSWSEKEYAEWLLKQKQNKTQQPIIEQPKNKPNKYRNEKVEFEGVKFDSKKELSRYLELKLLERGGLITNLELQKRFELIPKTQYGRARYYKCDFCYIDEKGELVVEDVKSEITKTDLYKLKYRLMQEVHNITIKEIV
ncbi:MAG: DUF1064 domain-containing protein [Firmicutes bacterium]|nr:DUF1064 domain-containing protein [Bacillota bacterium]